MSPGLIPSRSRSGSNRQHGRPGGREEGKGEGLAKKAAAGELRSARYRTSLPAATATTTTTTTDAATVDAN
jgi:hypothetical protein